MASFIPSKKEATDFNKGVQYISGDVVQAITVNNLVESALYSQSEAELAHAVSDSALTAATEALDKIDNVIGNIGLSAYPVGAYYISNTSTSPASLFGGSWTEVTGRFLYANHGGYVSASNTGQGGSADAILVNHTHYMVGSNGNSTPALASSPNSAIASYRDSGGGSLLYELYAAPDAASRGQTSSAGGSGTGANMPPYQTVYAWRRTA